MLAKSYYKKFITYICGFIALTLIFPLNVSAYELTDIDYNILDKVEEKIFDRIETNPSVTAKLFINRIETILEKRKLNDRTKTLLKVLIEDIVYFTSEDEGNNEDLGYSDGESDEYTLTAEDCYEDEYYDAKEQWCYVKENSDSDYGLDEDQNWSDDGDHSLQAGQEEKQNTEFEASYDIQLDDSLKLAQGKENIQHKEVWKLFTSLIVPSYRKDLIKMNFFRDTENETFAYVEQIKDDENHWQMAVNLALFYKDGEMDKKESIHTLIHEYTHVLTLNKTQVTYTPFKVVSIIKYEKACTTFYIQEGCLKKTAYLKAFIKAFWSDSERKKANNGDEVKYSEDNFVSEYASTNPGEDIAESFTSFVLNSKPSGANIAEKKMLFFYNYPELVKIRTLIRGRLPR